MNPKTPFTVELIAPCGMNCAICKAYTRGKLLCDGCNSNEKNKSKYCSSCRIKNCTLLKKSKSAFCFACEEFPCAILKYLDQSYQTKYSMSILENLENIRKGGIRNFVQSEIAKWACPK